MPPDPEALEAVTPRGVARYYVLRVHSIEHGDPGLVSVIAGPFLEFNVAWYSVGAMRRIYPNQIFVAGEMCLF